MFYASVGNNPHSAEVFPDGNLVVASTDNDGFLNTFRVDTVARTGQIVQKVPLTFCHSAVWDRSRGRLLATSDNKLCVFTYNGDGNDPASRKSPKPRFPGATGRTTFSPSTVKTPCGSRTTAAR